MPQHRHSELTRLLATPGGGVFFLEGEEDFLKEEAVRQILDAHLDPATRDFNLDQLAADDAAADRLAPLLATPPMMAPWRGVVLRDAQGLSASGRAVVEEVAATPPAGLLLVITATKPARSKAAFYTRLAKAAHTISFPSVGTHDAPGWLLERAGEEFGLRMVPDAARGLVAAVGPNLGVLSAELAKVAAYVAPRVDITTEDVKAVCGAMPHYDRWEWFDLVGARDNQEAMRQLPVLLGAGESGVGLVIGLASQLLRLAIANSGGKDALERALKPYQRWLARRILPQARRWTLPELDDALADLLRTDQLLKSASLTELQAMEELLLRLAARREQEKRTAA